MGDRGGEPRATATSYTGCASSPSPRPFRVVLELLPRTCSGGLVLGRSRTAELPSVQTGGLVLPNQHVQFDKYRGKLPQSCFSPYSLWCWWPAARVFRARLLPLSLGLVCSASPSLQLCLKRGSATSCDPVDHHHHDAAVDLNLELGGRPLFRSRAGGRVQECTASTQRQTFCGSPSA